MLSLPIAKLSKMLLLVQGQEIVSIRQFWKYLKTKAHLIDNNIAEELETPKLPKRIPKYLSLEESVKLLIELRLCTNMAGLIYGNFNKY